MIQLRYRVPKGMRPTLEQLRMWRAIWIVFGRQPLPVRIHAVDWRYGGSQKQIRARLEERMRKATRRVETVPGIVERYAEPNVTMCDYDRSHVRAESRVWSVSRLLGVRPEWIEFRRTARGWHVVVKWDSPEPMSPTETVALQAILGSDPFREAFNLARVMTGKTHGGRWNLLFREKIR